MSCCSTFRVPPELAPGTGWAGPVDPAASAKTIPPGVEVPPPALAPAAPSVEAAAAVVVRVRSSEAATAAARALRAPIPFADGAPGTDMAGVLVLRAIKWVPPNKRMRSKCERRRIRGRSDGGVPGGLVGDDSGGAAVTGQGCDGRAV